MTDEDWVDDESLSRDETLRRFEQLPPADSKIAAQRRDFVPV